VAEPVAEPEADPTWCTWKVSLVLQLPLSNFVINVLISSDNRANHARRSAHSRHKRRPSGPTVRKSPFLLTTTSQHFLKTTSSCLASSYVKKIPTTRLASYLYDLHFSCLLGTLSTTINAILIPRGDGSLALKEVDLDMGVYFFFSYNPCLEG